MNPILGVSDQLDKSVVRKYPEAKKMLKGAIQIFQNLRKLDILNLPPAKRRKIESLIANKSDEQSEIGAKLEAKRTLTVQILPPVRRITSGNAKIPQGSPVSPLTPLPPLGEFFLPPD